MSEKCKVNWSDIDGASPKPKRLHLEKDEADSLYHCPIQECDHDGFQVNKGVENMLTSSAVGSSILTKNPIRNKSIFQWRAQFKINQLKPQNSPKSSMSEQCVLPQIGTRNKTVLNDQFGNNVFHAQIGTQNKTVVTYQFQNNMSHAQIGILNKTVLYDQFGNNVFHLQTETRSKTVLNDIFGNNVFHAQIGTRNKTV